MKRIGEPAIQGEKMTCAESEREALQQVALVQKLADEIRFECGMLAAAPLDRSRIGDMERLLQRANTPEVRRAVLGISGAGIGPDPDEPVCCVIPLPVRQDLLAA